MAFTNMFFRFLLLTLCVVLAGQVVHTKIIQGTIETFDNFYFLVRFCFSPNNGKASFKFNYRRENAGAGVPTYNSLLMYYDSPEQWQAAYKTSTSCLEKVDLLQEQGDTDQIAELRQTEEMYCQQENNTIPQINCSSNFENKEAVYEVGDPNIVTFHDGYIGFQNSRARWWYFAISNCVNPNGVSRMEYSVELTNGDTFWNRHVSADEIGILETECVFIILFLYLTMVATRIAVVLSSRQLYHTSFKIFLASVILQAVATIVTAAYRYLINDTGMENKPLEYVGKGARVVSETLFISLLILLSKGWTVVRGRLSTEGTMVLSASITFYFIAQLVALFWEAYMFDPGQVLYEYESAPGYCVIACILLMWIWFCRCNLHTWQRYPEKNTFYFFFFIAYSIWFLAKPVIVLVAAFQLEHYYREKAVNIILNSNTFFAYSVFLVLTRPSAANKSFPFHVRTSQIGIESGVEVVDAGPAAKEALQDRSGMFQTSGPLTGNRGDAYAVGFTSVAYNTESAGLEMRGPSHI